MYQNAIYIVFLDIAKFGDFRWKNVDISRTEGVCHVTHTFFGCFFKARCKYTKFHHCRICMTDFRERVPSPSPPRPLALHPWVASKRPIMNKVKINTMNYMFFSAWVMFLEWIKHALKNTEGLWKWAGPIRWAGSSRWDLTFFKKLL